MKGPTACQVIFMKTWLTCIQETRSQVGYLGCPVSKWAFCFIYWVWWVMTCREIGWAILIVPQMGGGRALDPQRRWASSLWGSQPDALRGDIKGLPGRQGPPTPTLHLLVTVCGERRDSEIKLHVNQMVPILSVCWNYSFVIAHPRARVNSVVNMWTLLFNV